MSTYIRTLVSGNKSRYKDKDLNLDLDLAYITDNVIVMGYPAAGLEGLYRNRREDAKKFLQHRHGNNFWVFNFCPIRENSYPASFFDGRVSRYPFPDHHSPPLAILPLIAREMRLWLEGSKQRVAVLHCKAGKGRSGTMACSYLLTLEDAKPLGGAQNTTDVRARAEERANEVMNVMPGDDDREDAKEAAHAEGLAAPSPTALRPTPSMPADPPSTVLGEDQVHSPRTMSCASTATETATSVTSPTSPTPADSNATERPQTPVTTAQPASLQSVLELHTSKRMKPGEKVKQGVSIPSQRRWLLYWSLLLANSGPRGFWGITPPGEAANVPLIGPTPKIRVRGLTVRMREPRGVVAGLTRAVNTIAEQTAMRNKHAPRTPKNAGAVWVSLARYDDKLVETLEGWERHSRGETLGARAPSKDSMQGETIEKMFEDGRWDKDKMVKSFARMGAVVPDAALKAEDKENGKYVIHKLSPLSDTNWSDIRAEIQNEPAPKEADGMQSEAASVEDLTATLRPDSRVVVDAFREMRGKLYMGQVFFGWFWLIPAFHMAERVPGQPRQPPTKLLLTRKEIDFPFGVGESLLDIELELEWCEDSRETPAKQSSAGSSGLAAGAAGLAANVGPSVPGS